MNNAQPFEYREQSGNITLTSEIPASAHHKTRGILEYFNRAGVLMEGNGILEKSAVSYFITVKNDKLIQIVNRVPNHVVSIETDELIQPRILVNETIELIREWVGDEYLSKRLIGQTVLMRLIHPELDRRKFILSAQRKLTPETFLDVIKIGGGEFEEELTLAGELPEFLRDALKKIV